MRRFLISSVRFEGTCEIVYNENGALCFIDLRTAGIEEPLIEKFLRSLSANVGQLAEKFGPGTTIVEAEFDVNFEMFWKIYPIHRNKYKAEKLWSKLSKSDQVKAYYALIPYQAYLRRNSWQTPMFADRFLRDREYETDWSKL